MTHISRYLISFALVGLAACEPEGNLPSSRAARVVVGHNHTCALTTTGTMACWGYGEHGELGSVIAGSESAVLHHVLRAPTKIEGLTGVTDFDTFSQHGCAVVGDGTVSCWGVNSSGQLGDGTTSTQMTPVKVAGLSGITSVRTGCDFSCALTSTGGVKCWGANDFQQLGVRTHITTNPQGQESSDPSLTPLDVPGLTSGVASIAAGCFHACAVMATGALKCWGRNSSGQVGQVIETDPQTSTKREWIDSPTDVPQLSGVTEAALMGDSSCALTMSGGMKCWGSQADGLLGNGIADDGSLQITPVDVTGLTSGVTALGGTCAIAGGSVKCWSSNLGNGAMGNGTDGAGATSTVPVSVTGISNAVQVSSGDQSCAVTADGAIKCWGTNEFGQLGNGHDAYIDLPGEFYTVTPVDVISFP
jgi:alpha-tubulin suppressor-like RCC1 family protein